MGFRREVIEDEQLLADAVQTVESVIDAARLGGRPDFTFEYRGGLYIEVDQPAWWIATEL